MKKLLEHKKLIIIISISIIILVCIASYFILRKDNEVLKRANTTKRTYGTYVQIPGTDKYKLYTEESFPSPSSYELNKAKSYCVDLNNEKIDSELVVNENGSVTLTSSITAYCFLYYDKLPSFAEDLVDAGVMWESGLEGDGYRFVGSGNASSSTTPKNFVCFGTSDKGACTGNPNTYMYRIIGVFPDEVGVQHVKLIKYANLSTTMEWNDTMVNIDWGNSTLYTNLNGSTFLTNTTYVPSDTWRVKIANWKWTTVNTKTSESSGLNYYSEVNTQQMYLHEMNRSNKTSTIGSWTTPSAKIGLMYASDYQMSLGSSSLNYIGSSNYSALKTGWMHITNNVNLSSSIYEWTISRYGDYSGYYYAWCVNSGFVDYDYVTITYAVRPVFYLASTVQLQSGSGTISDPYIIK